MYILVLDTQIECVNLNETYSHFSLEEVGPNQLIFFLNSNNSKDNSTFQLIDFNATAESEENKLIVKESYSLNIENIRTNSHCVLTSSNMLACGLIIINSHSTYSSSQREISYKILLLNKNKISKYNIFSETYDSEYLDYGKEDENGVFEYNYLKMVPLDDDQVYYCYFWDEDYNCGLIELSDKGIKMLIKEQKIFSYKNTYASNYAYKKNIFHALKISYNQVILSTIKDNNNKTDVARVTIWGSSLFIIDDATIQDLNGITSSIYYLKFLKNNNDDLIYIMAYNSKAAFQELSFSTCNNYTATIYNGETPFLNLVTNPVLFNDKTIVFFNNGKEINSLINGYGSIVKENVTYKDPYISFKFNSKDYDEINKNKKYSLEFSSSLNESEAQRCRLTLYFYDCRKECELCTSDPNSCYDRYGNIIDFSDDRTDFEKYFFILPLSILVMLVILIFFSFTKCLYMKQQLPNYGGNALANGIPLITS